MPARLFLVHCTGSYLPAFRRSRRGACTISMRSPSGREGVNPERALHTPSPPRDYLPRAVHPRRRDNGDTLPAEPDRLSIDRYPRMLHYSTLKTVHLWSAPDALRDSLAMRPSCPRCRWARFTLTRESGALDPCSCFRNTIEYYDTSAIKLFLTRCENEGFTH